jgi:hypothetical protein
VDTVPDPLLRRNFCSAGNRTLISGSVATCVGAHLHTPLLRTAELWVGAV